MKRIVYLLVLGLLLATPVFHVAANDIQISQGFTYLSGTAKLSWYGPTYKADAPWAGFELNIVSPDSWWAEIHLSTGEEDSYFDGLDTIYAREALFLAGLFSPRFELGLGGIWMSVDYRGCYPPHNSFGALAAIQTRIPISRDRLAASMAIVAQPIVFGKDPLPCEFIELYAGIDMELSWLKIAAGYKYRHYYNFKYTYNVSGLLLSFQFRLEGDSS
ncbi:hypothetical protein KAH43_06435 [Candidatus Bipolaricaulota bacterium]|nr:hypothetical protein [Candidatus Bipolaricaulota bacterium]